MSEKVKEGKAHGVELCGEKLVLFRGKDGKVGLLQRHVNLSLTFVKTHTLSVFLLLLTQTLHVDDKKLASHAFVCSWLLGV